MTSKVLYGTNASPDTPAVLTLIPNLTATWTTTKDATLCQACCLPCQSDPDLPLPSSLGKYVISSVTITDPAGVAAARRCCACVCCMRRASRAWLYYHTCTLLLQVPWSLSLPIHTHATTAYVGS